MAVTIQVRYIRIMNKHLKVDKKNAFVGTIDGMLLRRHETTKVFIPANGSEGETITYSHKYIDIPFTKVTQNKEVFNKLSPWECKVVMYIILNLSWQQQKIKIPMSDVGLDRRKYREVMLNLQLLRIVSFEKREWYWVNLTLLINGTLSEESTKHIIINGETNPTQQST